MVKGKGDRYRSETEIPPHTKLVINVTIERAVVEEMKRIHDEEIRRAKAGDRSLPDWSNTCEMICRKGVRTYRKEIPNSNKPQIE